MTRNPALRPQRMIQQAEDGDSDKMAGAIVNLTTLAAQRHAVTIVGGLIAFLALKEIYDYFD